MHNHLLEAIVPEQWDGQRLDRALAHLFPEYSRTYLQEHIRYGNVLINRIPVEKTNFLVRANHYIQIQLISKKAIPDWEGDASIPLFILHEDEALLVVNKPAGIVTHPAPGHLNGTLVNALLHHLPALVNLPRAGIIHRLDKDTSGLLVIPKTMAAYNYLIQALAARHIERIYHTVVKGQLTTGGTINFPIGRHPILRQKQAVTPKGKPAITHYRIIKQFAHHTLLTVKLETGRTHQIRVHMAHINHAILGDPVYGRKSTRRDITFKRQALHAHILRLLHPLTQKYCEWIAPIPDDMRQLIEGLSSGIN